MELHQLLLKTTDEVSVAYRYESEITGTAENGFIVINRYKPPVPDTGESSNSFLWIILNLISGVSLTGIYVHRSRREKSR